MENIARYIEEQALKMLKIIFGDIYSDCVIADKPDIQARDGSIGVEVTLAADQEMFKATQAMHINALNSIGDRHKICSDEKLKKIVEVCGGELCKKSGIIAYKTNPVTPEEAQKIIWKRIEDKQKNKLGNYQDFPHKQLFIYGNTDCYDKMRYASILNNILHSYRELYLGDIHFEKIFIFLDDRGILYELDVENGCVVEHPIP